jgi:ankyrin repeat protein
MIPRVEELIAGGEPTDQELTDAFWQACHGGQRRMAELLLARGADLNGTSWGGGTPLDVAEGVGTGREALLTWLRERGARNSTKPAKGDS